MDFLLKYGCNPHQIPARLHTDESKFPFTIINGNPSYINFLDALNAWQLVRELKKTLYLPAAASFKHVSPAGAAVAAPLTDTLTQAYFLDDIFKKNSFGEDNKISPIASAYIRARGADRLSSYGDFIALSDKADISLARFIASEVSDGIIAPDYDKDALTLLKQKRKGNYIIIKMDSSFEPNRIETREVFGIELKQLRNNAAIDDTLLTNAVTNNKIPDDAASDLLLAMIVAKYTQSNSVCYSKDGQAIGIGAGQQSRVHCTRLAGNKADIWHLRQHPKVLDLPFKCGISRPERDNAIDLYISPEESPLLLKSDMWESYFTTLPAPLTLNEREEWLSAITGVSLASDAFFPFEDNILRAARSGVKYIAQPGGSIRDDAVIKTCNGLGIAMAFTGLRLFHH